ncbi:MAG: thiamine-phosphate kinase [Verrucomicrobia bacterium]|nr:thiamine-phosphate kinase [Verrucomicrobiota bacterium]
MQIKDWGEEEIVAYLREHFHARPPVVGIGDDCAILPGGMLIKTDGLLEGIHFIKEQIPPQELGYKLIAVNVSDIASKGGSPQYALLTMALPPSTDSAWLKEVITGIHLACEKWEIQLIGGDTDGSKRDLYFNLMLIGTSPHVKFRHEAKEGDLICVTHYLGDSGGGLRVLQENLAGYEDLVKAHFHPEPSPAEGIWLSKQNGVHAMMDISDGLDIDLNRLIRASKCGALVELSKLPLSSPLLALCEKQSWDPIPFALTGGEDYCLLLTVDKNSYEQISKTFFAEFGHPLFAIGEIRGKKRPIQYEQLGKAISLELKTYDHFNS